MAQSNLFRFGGQTEYTEGIAGVGRGSPASLFVGASYPGAIECRKEAKVEHDSVNFHTGQTQAGGAQIKKQSR